MALGTYSRIRSANATSSPVTASAITFPNGNLITVSASVFRSSSTITAPTISSSPSLTWTLIEEVSLGNPRLYIRVWYAIGTGVSTSVTITSANANEIAVNVGSVSGASTDFSNKVKGTVASGSLSLTLPSAPAASSYATVCIENATNSGPSTPTGYTAFGKLQQGTVCSFDQFFDPTSPLSSISVTDGLATASIGILFEIKAASAGPYTMPLAAGAFTETGQALGLRYGHKTPLAAASFALSGQALATRTARRVALAATSYALTGQNILVRYPYRLPLAAGSYALAGPIVTLRRTATLPLAATSFALAGQTILLRHPWRLVLAPTAFVLAGQTLSVRYGRQSTLAAASFVLSGQALALRPARKLPLAPASFAESGQALVARYARKFPLAAAVFSLVGQLLNLLRETAGAISQPVLLDTNGAAGATIVSHAFNTILGATLIVCVGARRDSATAPGPILVVDTNAIDPTIFDADNQTITDADSGVILSEDTGSGITWLSRVDDVIQGTIPSMRAALFSAVGTGGSLSVSASSVNADKIGLHVVQITNAKGGILNTGHDTSPSGDPAPTLTAAPGSGSIVIGFGAFAGTSTIPTPVPLATELVETVVATDLILETAFTRLSGPQTATWTTANAKGIGLLAEVATPATALETAAYVTTGQGLTLRSGRVLQTGAGSFTLAGQPVGLVRSGGIIQLVPATFIASGKDINLRHSRRMTLAAASYSLTGQILTPVFGRRIVTAPASFTLAGATVRLVTTRLLALTRLQLSVQGENVALGAVRKMTVGATSYALVGISIKAAYSIKAAAGDFSLAGKALNFAVNRAILLGARSFALDGLAIVPRARRQLSLGVGNFVAIGQPLTLARSAVLNLSAGSVAVAGADISVRRGWILELEPSDFAVAGQDLALRATIKGGLGVGTFSVTGQPIVTRATRIITLAPSSWAVTGQNLRLATGWRINLAAASLTSAGQALNLRSDRRLALAPTSFATSGQALVLSRSRIMPVAAAALAVNAPPIGLLAARRASVAAGAYTLAGQPIAFQAGRRAALAPGSFALAGQAVFMRRPAVMALAPASFVLTGKNVGRQHGYMLRTDRGVLAIEGQPIEFTLVKPPDVFRPTRHLRGSYVPVISLKGEAKLASANLVQLRGDIRQTFHFGTASVPGELFPGEVPLLTGQDAEIRRHQYVVLEFVVAYAAGAISAVWYVGERASTMPADVLLTISSPPATLLDQGADCVVSVPLSESQTEGLPAGRLFHQLWIVDSLSRSVPAAEGVLTVDDSLRS